MVNSLSVEETNVLRAQLGLKLIPVLKGSKGGLKNHILVTVNRISIKDTNELRSQLGLKLIPINDTEDENHINDDDKELKNYLDRENSIKKIQEVDDLKKSLEVKKSLLKRQRQLARGGILDRSSESQSLEDWLAQIGQGNDIIKSNKEDNNLNKSTKADKKLKFKSTNKTKEAKDNILTLKDKDVLDDKSDDELVNKDVEFEKKIQNDVQSRKLETGEMVSDINRDNRLLGSDDSETNKKRKLVSLRSLESDDELDDDEQQREYANRDIAKPKFKKHKTKSNSKIKTQTRSKERDIDVTFKPVLLIDEDDYDDQEDEMDKLLSATRVEKLKKRVFSEPLPDIRNENNDAPSNGEIIQENLQFLDTLDTDKNRENKPPVLNHSKGQEINNINSDLSNRVTSIIRDQSNDQNYSISSILSHFNERNDKSSEPESEIKIKYTDDKGHELSTKEAYKFMSRKFHGTYKKGKH